jgi:hypothetical protein
VSRAAPSCRRDEPCKCAIPRSPVPRIGLFHNHLVLRHATTKEDPLMPDAPTPGRRVRGARHRAHRSDRGGSEP